MSLRPPKENKRQQGQTHSDRPESESLVSHRGRKGRSRSPLDADAARGRNEGGGGAPHPSEDSWRRREEGGGGGVVTLDEAVADFEDALRDHRTKRRGLLGSTTAIGFPEIGGENSKYAWNKHGHHGSPHDSVGASNWLDKEAADWTTVDFGVDGLRDSQHCDKKETESTTSTSSPTHARGSRGEATVARMPQPSRYPAQQISERVGPSNGEAEDKTPLVRVVENDGAPPIDRRLLMDVEDGPVSESPASVILTTLEKVAEGKELGPAEPVGQSQDPDWRPAFPSAEPLSPGPRTGGLIVKASPATLDGAELTTESKESQSGNAGCEPSASPNSRPVSLPLENIQVTTASGIPTKPKQEGEFGTEHPSESRPLGLDAVPRGLSGDHSSRPHEAASDGNKMSARSNYAAANRPWGGEKTIQQVGDASVSLMKAAEKKSPIAIDPKAASHDATGPIVATPILGMPVVAGATASAEAMAAAMQSPDQRATFEQRTAGDWIAGTTSKGAPAVLEAAKAEAELADRVNQLRSKRLALEREEREALEEGRTRRFEQEHATRTLGFAEEDRQLLAAEEQRLADLRREIDLGRLQRGAEFEETDQVLAVARTEKAGSTTTGPVHVPVRGMRPQHFREAEDLPDTLRQAAAPQPAENVLDEMEKLAIRAKATGGGVSLEAFEKVEERQRARQVERLNILHGQTAEEKFFTVVKMVVRVQTFVRARLAGMRVAKLRDANSSSEEKVGGANSRGVMFCASHLQRDSD